MLCISVSGCRHCIAATPAAEAVLCSTALCSAGGNSTLRLVLTRSRHSTLPFVGLNACPLRWCHTMNDFRNTFMQAPPRTRPLEKARRWCTPTICTGDNATRHLTALRVLGAQHLPPLPICRNLGLGHHVQRSQIRD